MAHTLIVVEGRKMWMDAFIDDLTERRYHWVTKATDKKTGKKKPLVIETMPNVREVKLLDISLPESAIPYLLDDLAPFWNESDTEKSFLKSKAVWIANLFRLFAGLRRINYDPTPSGEVRNKFINVVPIGWREDRFEDEKGELL